MGWVLICAVHSTVALSCEGARTVRPELSVAATNALSLSDALEALIADGKDTEDDREIAWDLVQKLPVETAGDAFGRAAIAGRLAEKKGALSLLGQYNATSLVAEAENYALKSRSMDPAFREGAAIRMLGSLYVLAPANMLEGGDSEDGLALLEGLVETHPQDPNNHLRLAEAYIALGDREPARKPLCTALSMREKLRKDHAVLADKLAQEAGPLNCPRVPVPASAPSAPPGETLP